jgi:alkylhydroperoxidase family enzyme
MAATASSPAPDRAKVPSEVTDALPAGWRLPDARLDALAGFVTTMVDTRGLPSRTDVEAFLGAGFEETDILQVVLAIAVKTISNYTNHLSTPRSIASSRTVSGRNRRRRDVGCL